MGTVDTVGLPGLSDPGLTLPSLPACESTSQKWQPASQTQSLFFRLPAELRQLILREAFGDQSIHIELHQRDRSMYLARETTTNRPAGVIVPQRWRDKAQTRAREWRNRSVSWLQQSLHLRPKEAPLVEHDLRRGRWCGSVCHRGRVRRRDGDGRARWEPSTVDMCWACSLLSSSADSPLLAPPLLPQHSSIGAMGFMLSCKRA